MRLSIVIPVLDEAEGIEDALSALAPLRAAGAQVVVVDGGSVDDTAARAAPLADRVLRARRGRASQMNAGVAVADGDAFLFLHADTRLPEGALAMVTGALAGGRLWGRFDVEIEGSSPWLRRVAAMMNLRSRITGIATGDQAMFVAREAFAAAGGFPDIPLMEDIALSRVLRTLGRPAGLRARVVTSGRRWERHGVWRTILLMWRLRLRYWLGADPRRLAVDYGYAPCGQDCQDGRVAVAILAKAPVPGEAKTRLIPALGAEGAARLHHQLLRRTLEMALAADVGPVTLWCAGDPDHPGFAAFRGLDAVELRAQPEGDLGARMLAALQGSSMPAGALVIGTDCPGLSVEHLRLAAESLRRHDATVFPAEDGGYVLIGAKAPAPELFSGIDWGTDRVMAKTRERLAALGWRWEEPATLWDVDRPADLARLAAEFPDISTTSNFPHVIRVQSERIGCFRR